MEERMKQQLHRRRQEGSLRQFLPLTELAEDLRHPDFSSNDYLGLAHCPEQHALVEESYHRYIRKQHDDTGARMEPTLGATGSRLLSGDTVLARQLEAWLARLHQRPAALLCNSGYDANLCVVSSIPLSRDVVLLDELCHNSLVMGLRSSRVECHESFRHNNVQDLKRLLEKYKKRNSNGILGNVLILVESVYSMDGDIAPLSEILTVAQEYDARVVVDEAHGLGLYGRTNRENLGQPCHTSLECSEYSSNNQELGGTGVLAALQLETHPALLCSIHTFGKAAGAHGAVIACNSQTLKDYLINYARPFVYSTALPTHSLIAIQCSYETMISREKGDKRRRHVFAMVQLFRSLLLPSLSSHTTAAVAAADSSSSGVSLWPSPSPIQALVVPGNDTCVEFCQRIRARSGIRLFPIRAPTVPQGQERVRIILHAHNTEGEVRELVVVLVETLRDMGSLLLFQEEIRPARL